MPWHLSTSIGLCNLGFQCAALVSGIHLTAALKKGVASSPTGDLSIIDLLEDAEAMTEPRVSPS